MTCANNEFVVNSNNELQWSTTHSICDEQQQLTGWITTVKCDGQQQWNAMDNNTELLWRTTTVKCDRQQQWNAMDNNN